MTDNLKQKIDQAIIAYYGMEDPTMEDKEFDVLFEKVYGENESPYKIFQQLYSGSHRKRPLKKKMLSLSKVKSAEKLDSWMRKMKENNATHIVLAPKFDGLACLIETDNESKIISAITRGNGTIGEDITYIIGNIRIDEKLSPNSLYQAEIMLPKENLKKASDLNRKIKADSVKDESLKEKILKETPDYSHPRNAAAGLVRLTSKYTKESATLLKLAFHYSDNLYNSKKISIDTPIEKIVEKIVSYHEEFKDDWFLNDGVVIFAYKEDILLDSLGDDGARPRWAVAWKFENVSKLAKIENIIWSKGRTKNTPIAIFSPPIDFDGVKVSRATLHNQDFIDELDIQVGDTVNLIRSNEVIPYVVSVHEKGENRYKVRDNSDSQTIHLPITKHFFRTLDIYGAGHQFCVDFSNKSKIKYSDDSERIAIIKMFNDIIKDKEILSSFTGMKNDNSKKKTSIHDEMISKINKATNEQLLACLGYQGIGIRKSKIILKNIDDFNDLKNKLCSPEDLHSEGIKEKSLLPIVESKDEFDTICDIFLKVYEKKEQLNNSEDMTKVVLTGKMDKPRKEIEKVLLDNNYELSSSVSKEIFALITNDMSSSSSKMTKARELNVKIIECHNLEDLIDLLDKQKDII